MNFIFVLFLFCVLAMKICNKISLSIGTRSILSKKENLCWEKINWSHKQGVIYLVNHFSVSLVLQFCSIISFSFCYVKEESVPVLQNLIHSPDITLASLMVSFGDTRKMQLFKSAWRSCLPLRSGRETGRADLRQTILRESFLKKKIGCDRKENL